MVSRFAVTFAAACLLLAGPLAADDIVITEIMYDPASEERWPAKTEWVEIYNRGDRTISLEGWHLANERGQTEPILPPPEGEFEQKVEIAPGEAVVLIPGNQTVDNFRAAWGDGFQVIPLTRWHQPGLHQLTNQPSEEAGVLELRRTAGDMADAVNYHNEARWPANKPDGPSIYLLPHAINTTANDDGANWARADADRHGARHAKSEGGYDQRDVGSPGVVVTTDEEDASAGEADTSE
ncbi:MAG: lamin tail domain-containing protein [Phycisphaeraceae bacterium]